MLVIVLSVHGAEQAWGLFCILLSTTEISARSLLRCVLGWERREA